MMRQHRVLVLNRAWMAVRFVTIQRAFKLLYTTYRDGTPKARVVDRDELDAWGQYSWEDWSKLRPKDDEESILASNGTNYRLPQIILLTKYDKTYHSQAKFNRKTIYKRDNYQCYYCKEHLTSQMLTLDHLVPRSKGGKTTWQNCCLCCVPCNRAKANKPPQMEQTTDGMFYKVFFRDGKKSWQIIVKAPEKPKYNLFQGEPPKIIPASWSAWISEVFWNITLENDNDS